ncbi:hypothetical protein UFOVP1106_55 [uncultured Caudovirales phage]|uniref:Uncharacterized protein n=1 Tax=uncultured Caudovirales phage TaxID=2100421 RepID=A0A6J5QME5_9CAUD|nr:hypothetical protein UFOVP1106_55 [uncultured Caudovirales phage]
MLNPNQIKTFSLNEIREIHQREAPQVMLGFFMDNYCHNILETNSNIYLVQVIVSDEQKYLYRKPKLEIVR